MKKFMKLDEEHTKDINDITCPTLIFWGNKDDVVPKDSVLYVYDKIASKSVTLVEINELTHDLFINDRYTEVLQLITKFFRTKPINCKRQKDI